MLLLVLTSLFLLTLMIILIITIMLTLLFSYYGFSEPIIMKKVVMKTTKM